MNSLKKYIPCLLLSLILVFASLGTSAVIIAGEYANADKLIELSEENEIVPMIKTQLENHFSDKYNTTGIPAEVYMDAITDEYLLSVVNGTIDEAFDYMQNEKSAEFTVNSNTQLEESITDFFSDYAESIGYEKDANYYNRIDAAVDSAYRSIEEYCDIYKFRTIYREGLLTKAAPIYQNLNLIKYACLAVTVLLIVIIVLINIKSLSAALYWTGISSLISGAVGIIPCIYLNATNYFDAFVIKQSQIFTAFTGAMYSAVDSFMVNQIILAAVGVVLIIAYAVVNRLKMKEK